MTDFSDFDLTELDDEATKVPSGEPNSSPHGVYTATYYGMNMFKSREKLTRNLVLQWQIDDGEEDGELCQQIYSIERDKLKWFIFDMDKLQLGDQARGKLSGFIPELDDLLDGVRIQLELKGDKTGQYTNMFINKMLNDDDDDDDGEEVDSPFDN